MFLMWVNLYEQGVNAVMSYVVCLAPLVFLSGSGAFIQVKGMQPFVDDLNQYKGAFCR